MTLDEKRRILRFLFGFLGCAFNLQQQLEKGQKGRRIRCQLHLSAFSSFNTIGVVVVAATVAVFMPLPRLINGQQQWKVASRERGSNSNSSHKIQMYLVCVSWSCLRPPAKVYERDLLKVSASCFLLLYLPF